MPPMKKFRRNPYSTTNGAPQIQNGSPQLTNGPPQLTNGTSTAHSMREASMNGPTLAPNGINGDATRPPPGLASPARLSGYTNGVPFKPQLDPAHDPFATTDLPSYVPQSSTTPTGQSGLPKSPANHSPYKILEPLRPQNYHQTSPIRPASYVPRASAAPVPTPSTPAPVINGTQTTPLHPSITTPALNPLSTPVLKTSASPPLPPSGSRDTTQAGRSPTKHSHPSPPASSSRPGSSYAFTGGMGAGSVQGPPMSLPPGPRLSPSPRQVNLSVPVKQLAPSPMAVTAGEQNGFGHAVNGVQETASTEEEL